MPTQACLADFGLSTLTPSAPGEMSTITAGGTPLYMAPELLNPDKYGEKNSRPTKPADIYAFGMVIYEVLTGFDPFYDQNFGTIQLICRVVDGLRPTKPNNAKYIGFGSGTWELVKECWKVQSKRRPTVKRVLAHLAGVATSSATVGPILKTPRNDIANSLNPNSYIMVPLKISGLRQILPCPLRLFLPKVPTLRVPDRQALYLYNLRRPSSTDQPLHADPQIIRWLWEDLASANPRSIDHQLLTALVEREANRDIALTFRGQDATTVINTIKKVSWSRPSMSTAVVHRPTFPSAFKILKANQVSHATMPRALELMQNLAGIINGAFNSFFHFGRTPTNPELDPPQIRRPCFHSGNIWDRWTRALTITASS